MQKFKSCFWYLLMRILILIKDVFYLIVSLGLLVFCWMYDMDRLDEITGDMDVLDRKFTRFGR